MEDGDDFPDGASPAALQRILRKLSAGLDDLLSASGGILNITEFASTAVISLPRPAEKILHTSILLQVTPK